MGMQGMRSHPQSLKIVHYLDRNFQNLGNVYFAIRGKREGKILLGNFAVLATILRLIWPL